MDRATYNSQRTTKKRPETNFVTDGPPSSALPKTARVRRRKRTMRKRMEQNMNTDTLEMG